MFSELRSTFYGILKSRRGRIDLILLGAGSALALIAMVLLGSNGDHLKVMLRQYASLVDYQLSSLAFGSQGLLAFIGNFAAKNALVPTLLLSLSTLLILAFAVRALTRSLKLLRDRSSIVGEKSPRVGYKGSGLIGFTFLTLAIFPGAILLSASEETSKAFTTVEKDQANVWAEADSKAAEALTASLNAHTSKMEHETTKTQSQIACRSSSYSQTYYAGNSYINPYTEAGYYNSCRLLDYLVKNDSLARQQVDSADLRLSSAESYAESSLAILNTYKGNQQVATALANTFRISQLSLLSLAGIALLLPSIALLRRLPKSSAALSLKKGLKTGATGVSRRVKCPKCAEYVKSEALICKHCGSEFQQTSSDRMP